MSAVEKLKTKTCDLKGSYFLAAVHVYFFPAFSWLLNRMLAERFLLAETLVGVGSVAPMERNASSSNYHTPLRSCGTG